MGLLSLVPLPYRLLAIALLALALFGFGWVKGNAHGTEKLTEYIGQQAKEAVRIVTKRGEVTTQVVTKYIEVAAKTKTASDAVEKGVTNYGTLKLDKSFLSVAAVSLHDSAADNGIPDAARAVDGSPSGVETSALVATCTANYRTYHQVADELVGLQAWVREQQKVK